ncbi:PaaI family thioesterase [Streptococcus suis]|uniref:PaaI family thioesterase n=1 Tax=Streptococcus suis TaxID=1307 RepID=UPI001ABE9230|nr:PaaI family thioesterase [Streptococcus suis]
MTDLRKELANFGLQPIQVLDEYDIREAQPGQVTMEVRVKRDSLNPYQLAHGGYLFTLADSVAGMTVYSLGYFSVTLQSNINYLKAAKEGDCLSISGKCLHDGRTTKVIDVVIQNQAGELVANASFTMFVTKEVGS